MNKFFLFLFLMLSLPLISASGLQIVGDSDFQINKTIGSIESIIITLLNDDTFSFYNITFEENDFISMDTISSLAPGEEITFYALIDTNQEINQDIKISGLYEAQIGSSEEIYYVDVSFNDGIDPCILQVIKGDTVIWNSLNSIMLKMYNSDTNSEITILQPNTTYSSQFTTPQTLNYHFEENGWRVNDNNCQVIVLDDIGLIKNPLLDTLINLKINQNYEPTSIQATFIDTNYIMDFNDETGGSFQIKNNGLNIAKNIKLSAEWFIFSDNNFDLNPGITKGISYTIKPFNYIFNTDQTNKTHNKTLIIDGNFENHYEPFDIFINYADISNENYTSGGNSLKEWIDNYCIENPDDGICPQEPTIIYRYTNSSNRDFNVTYNQEQVQGLYKFDRDKAEEDATRDKATLELLRKMEIGLNLSSSMDIKNQEEIEKLKSLLEDKDALSVLITSIILILIIAICVYFIYLKLKNKEKYQALMKMFFVRKEE